MAQSYFRRPAQGVLVPNSGSLEGASEAYNAVMVQVKSCASCTDIHAWTDSISAAQLGELPGVL